LIHRVTQHWKENLKASVIEVLKDGTVELHEDDFLLDTVGETRLFGLRARFDNQKRLTLDVSGSGWVKQELDHITDGVSEQELVAAGERIKCGSVVLVLQDLIDGFVFDLLHSEVNE
jgi:hypothetical protein